MDCKVSIDLNEAKQSFVKLMQSLSETDQQKFLAFIAKEWKPESVLRVSNEIENSFHMLDSIVHYIRQKLPFSAILPSENIKPPSTGENSDCDPNKTLHIDEFLYTDEDIDKLIENDQLQTHYCLDCGSKNIHSLIFISHSMCLDGLLYIFNTLLNTSLKNKTILDIGSRIGAVLYGAYVLTDAETIIGVEMNEEFCNLQNDVIRKFKMNDRISVVHKRIEQVPDIIKQSDVIIFNNAFEFYLPDSVQIDIWKYLRATVKSGTLLVTRPSVETIFKTLNMDDISIEKWLRPFKNADFDDCAFLSKDKDEFSEILCYEVL